MRSCMKTYQLLFALLLSGLSAAAQPGLTLAGRVTDEEGRNIAYADLLILTNTDTSLVTTVPVVDGAFKSPPLPAAVYSCQVRAIGYADYRTTVLLEQDLAVDWRLQAIGVDLQEVTVGASRHQLINENGNIKLLVENSVLAQQVTPSELLSRLPGVLLSPDGESVQIVGRGSPLIYLENQRIDLQQLQALPVESIKSVEIIYNPSARFEAEGRSVILIRRRISLAEGIRLTLTETAQLRQSFSNYFSTNIALQKGRFEWQGNLSYNQLGTWEKVYNSFFLPVQQWSLEQTALAKGPRPQLVGGGGLFYQLKGQDYVLCICQC